MTEFKHGSNNYHNKKLPTADKAIASVTACDENSRRPRLKKSFSECESYDMDMSGSYNLSPARRKCREYHHCPRQTTINDSGGNNVTMGDISFIDIPKSSVPYNYDTSKSQYLLAQQQKLKEYKNDPTYLATNGDNYSSESSTETRGILKNKNPPTAASSTTTSESNASNNNNSSNNTNSNHSSKSLLKRNKGLSTLSLCSCDAETEVSCTCFTFAVCLLHPYEDV